MDTSAEESRAARTRDQLSADSSAHRALSVLLVSGEVSSDQHAAALVEELKQRNPATTVFGMGGSQLRSVGMETLVDSETVGSVMGVTEVFAHIRALLKVLRKLVQEAERRRPDVVVLLDFPDFNLRLARALKRRGFRIVYYIAPQIWAWRQGRVKQIRANVDCVAAIFPFEYDFYKRHQVNVQYVGHPFHDRQALRVTRDELLRSVGLDVSRPVIGLLPGSRRAEVRELLPQYLAAFDLIAATRPGVQGLLPVAPGLSLEELQQLVGSRDIAVVKGQARESLSFAAVSVVTSGTATVEAALCGVPFIVAYRMSPFTHLLAKLLVRGVKFFAMPNVILGEKVVEELLQDEVSPGRIAAEVERLLGDAEAYRRCQAGLGRVAEELAVGKEQTRATVASLIEEIAGSER